MTGKNIWRLCKVYGRRIGYPELEPHDLRHGVAMEVLEQHHARGSASLLGHARIDTTQIYTSIKQSQLKRAVSFYETKATKMLSEWGRAGVPGSRNRAMFLKHGTKNTNEIHLVAPTGRDRTCIIQVRDFIAR